LGEEKVTLTLLEGEVTADRNLKHRKTWLKFLPFWISTLNRFPTSVHIIGVLNGKEYQTLYLIYTLNGCEVPI
jgi:hypothetical protein